MKTTTVTNEVFLRGVFGTEWERAHVCAFREDPYDLDKLGLRHYWAGGPAKHLLGKFTREQNQYFTISLFNTDSGTGRARRKKSLHDTTHCIVLDDVGPVGKGASTAKVEWDRVLLKPSWVLETSPQNYQVGYIVSVGDTRSGKVSALLDALVASGLCSGNKDPGMKGVTRYVRLPEGSNRKAKYGAIGFQNRMVTWDPGRVYTLEDIADAYGVRESFDEAPDDLTTHQSAAVPEGEDRVLDALIRAGWYQSKIDANRWLITCPWMDEHTGRVNSGAAYLGDGNFKCHHGHCETRTSGEFLEKLMQDHPTEWKEAERESLMRDFGDIGGDRDPFEGLREGVQEQVEKLARVAALGKFSGAFSLKDVGGGLPVLDQNWVLKGLIPEQGVGVLYGAPKTGKTFVMLDLAYRVGAGMDWNGHVVKKPGLVVYVAAEGGHVGAWNRSKAWVEKWGVSPANVVVWPGTVRLGADVMDDARLLVEFVREEARRLGVEPALIVLDTLNRTMVGDENSAQDMAGYMNAVEWVRRELECFAMIVHHSGKDKSKGARGSSAAQGFVDIEIELDRDKSAGLGGVGEIVVANSRHGTDGQKYGFALELVKLGVDADLEDVTVPVVVGAALPVPAVKINGRHQKVVYEYLTIEQDFEAVSDAAIRKDLAHEKIKDLPRTLERLEKHGVIVEVIGSPGYWQAVRDVEVVFG